MRFKSFKIQNYKSFREPKEITFGRGFNIIIGKNNVGKTALINGLSLKFENNPHSSLATKPEPRTILNPGSNVTSSFVIPKEEAFSILFNSNKLVHVPLASLHDVGGDQLKMKELFDQTEWEIVFQILGGGKLSYARLLPHWNLNSNHALSYQFDDFINPPKFVASPSWQTNFDIALQLANEFISRVYTFSAERFHVGQALIDESMILKSDASNLPSVLANLKNRSYFVFSKVLRYFKIIFPNFTDVNLILIDRGSKNKILLSNTDPSLQRNDLDIPLQDSGTGVGQVLAMLYVVNTATSPKVFVIDEPQSFLHPGALQKLLSILEKDFSQHQYILSTHAPGVISSSNPTKIFQVRKEKYESEIRLIDIREKSETRAILSDVGARLSDVFGADNILWVEGQTEEACYPLIITRLSKHNLLGTKLVGVLNTGDFEGKNKKIVSLVIGVYKRLSTSAALIPPSLGFLFDRERLTKDEIDEFKNRTDNLLFFLERRMFENYFINPEAIVAHIETLDNFSENDISKEKIQSWLDENKWDPIYIKTHDDQKNDTYWTINVDGVKILDKLYKHFSDGKHSYEPYKVLYGPIYTEWIIKNSPSDFDEIVKLLDSILESRI